RRRGSGSSWSAPRKPKSWTSTTARGLGREARGRANGVASTSPAISVVVPAYNEAAGLAATLELVERAAAVLLQRDGSRAEIIVVDNASTDDTAALAARHHAEVVHESIRNIGRARNVGARASHGRTILFRS